MKNTKKNFDKSKEQKIVGINAVKMLFKKSPERVIKLYVDENSLKQFKEEMRLCGQLKKAYHIVKAVDLEKISNSSHHEGVVCIAVKPPCYSLKEFLAKKSDSSLIMALENVSNPHNIGAIARTAAHFGVDAFLVADASNFFSSASYRTAEGGMESIKVIQEKDFLKALKLLSEHKYDLIGTSSHSKDDVTQFKFKPHTVIMMGEERNGLSIDASKLCTKVLQIKGTNNVESMNVSLASGIVIYEYRKQFKIY